LRKKKFPGLHTRKKKKSEAQPDPYLIDNKTSETPSKKETEIDDDIQDLEKKSRFPKIISPKRIGRSKTNKKHDISPGIGLENNEIPQEVENSTESESLEDPVNSGKKKHFFSTKKKNTTALEDNAEETKEPETVDNPSQDKKKFFTLKGKKSYVRENGEVFKDSDNHEDVNVNKYNTLKISPFTTKTLKPDDESGSTTPTGSDVVMKSFKKDKTLFSKKSKKQGGFFRTDNEEHTGQYFTTDHNEKNDTLI
jgi:hypothetical protein